MQRGRLGCNHLTSHSTAALTYSSALLSSPDREAMESYINHSLTTGIIRPSLSPGRAGFFFVEKKDKSLRPSIDCRGLNNITVKNQYPLPLMASAFELLHHAKIIWSGSGRVTSGRRPSPRLQEVTCDLCEVHSASVSFLGTSVVKAV